MYLFSCPSLFCKASVDTLFSLSTCIFCPIIKYICKHTLYEVLLNSKGVGEGGRGARAPTFKSGGGTSGFVLPPPHFWAEQMFLFHYLLIFCG